jgi:transitional endoplasmic reticulum ATPase
MGERSMTLEFALPAHGRIDLDGTHRAIVEADLPDLERHLRELPEGAPAPTLLLEAGNRRCGCLLAGYRRSEAPRLLIDRFKLRHLGLEDGGHVAVRLEALPEALRVELSVSGEFGEREAARLIGKPLCAGEATAHYTFSGDPRPLRVVATRPAGPVVVTRSTAIRAAAAGPERVPVRYEDLGGLGREIARIREVVEYPLRFGPVFAELGVRPPRGIILHGPPGTGKTLIARALAGEVGARLFTISGPEIYSRWYGKSEENLRNVFEEAIKHAPSIVVVDELDALVPRRERSHGDQEQRIVATFLTQMDGLAELQDVVVVGTTNRLDAIDPALRRGGRFEHEIHIGVPDAAGRAEILGIQARRMPLAADVDLGAVAERTAGFVGADLAALCREAAYTALRRRFGPEKLAAGGAPDVAGIEITAADFDAAAAAIPPSGAREFATEIPRTGWDRIGGLDDIKRLLQENIAYAVTRREAFELAGVRPAAGILLHGPPGTGKTLLAQAVASECGANFISIQGPLLRSRFLGEAEERVRELFARARLLAPCVLFFDEIDAALPARGRETGGGTDSMVNQLLAEMDGIGRGRGVFVIGATNRLERLDPAALRPGRFDHLIEIPLPDRRAREAIFAVHLGGRPVAGDVDPAGLAAAAHGLSGADIAEICRGAAWEALREAGFSPEGLTIRQAQLERSLERVLAAARRRENPGRADR